MHMPKYAITQAHAHTSIHTYICIYISMCTYAPGSSWISKPIALGFCQRPQALSSVWAFWLIWEQSALLSPWLSRSHYNGCRWPIMTERRILACSHLCFHFSLMRSVECLTLGLYHLGSDPALTRYVTISKTHNSLVPLFTRVMALRWFLAHIPRWTENHIHK